MRSSYLVLYLAFLLVGTIASECFSQQTVDSTRLADSLRLFSEREVFGFMGNVESSQPGSKQSVLNGASNSQTIVISGGGRASQQFTGKFELMGTEAGEIAIRSIGDELPQIKTYDDGERSLSTRVVEGEPVSTTQVVSELAQLLDWKKFATLSGKLRFDQVI